MSAASPSDVLDMAPPADADAERALIAAIVVDPSIVPGVLDAGIRPWHFYDEAHRAVFHAVGELHADGKPVDLKLLVPKLRENPTVGTKAAALLAEIATTGATAANWAAYAERVEQVSKRRRLRFLGERLLVGSSNGKSEGELLADAARTLDGIRDGSEFNGRALTYRRITCAELAATDYDLEYLVEGTLVAGQPCIVAGPKKACKTTILIDLAISLAVGGYFLGRFRCNRAARVLLMTGESGLATVKESANRIADAAGYRLADIAGLIISDELPKLGDAEHLAALRKMLQGDEIEALILDPAYLCLPADGNESSLFAMGSLLRGISELCAACGATLILAHHAKKNVANPFDPPSLEDIAWSGFQEFARQWLLLARRQRYEPGSGEHRLWLSAGGSAGHSALWAVDIREGEFDGRTPRVWQVDVLRAAEAIEQADEAKAQRKRAEAEQKREAQLDADRRALVQAMVKHEDGETKSIFRDMAGLKAGRMEAALASLLADGTVEPCQITRGNNQKYDGYRLKPNAET